MPRKAPQGHKRIQRLLDEAYLFILTQHPTSVVLARELGVSKAVLDRILRRLSHEIKKSNLQVASAGRGQRKLLQIQAFGESRVKPVEIGPDTLCVRKMPPHRPGFKPEDLVIYSRDL